MKMSESIALQFNIEEKTKINNNKKIDDNDSIFLLINEKHIKIFKKKQINQGLLKQYSCFNLLSKGFLHVLLINDKVYLIPPKKIKEIKKYLYKKNIEANILLTNEIDVKKASHTNIFYFNNGLDITDLELINTKTINDIEDFFILKLKKEIKEPKNKDQTIININSEQDFKIHRKEILNNYENLSKNVNTNNIQNNEVKYIIESLQRIKEKESYYFNYKYQILKKNKEYIMIEYNNKEVLINKNTITKIEKEKQIIEFYYQNPFGEKFLYKFNIYLLNILREENGIYTYCFKNDYLKNDIFEINKNQSLIEI